MALDWDEFRLVRTIADRGGLTRAATQLGINHSTAFRRLAALEARLAVRLFERGRTGYVPTPAGEAMILAAARMEEEVFRFSRDVAGRAPTPSGTLRITTPASLLVDLLVPILARFSARYRDIRLDLVVSEEALNLGRRDADVAIRASDAPPPTLFGRRLATIRWAVYGRADRAPQDPAPQDSAPQDSAPQDPALQDLSACDWVTPGESVAGGRFVRFVEGRAAAERVVLRINTVLGLREAIEAGIGIGPLPCWAADGRPGLVRLSEPEPDLSSGLWLLTHPDLRHAPRVRAFMDFVGEEIGAMRAALER